NSAKSGGLNPIIAPWAATIIMFPLVIIFTKRATEDRGLFEMDHIIEPIKNMLNIKEKESIDYKFLYKFTNDTMFDVIENYEALGHHESVCFEDTNLLNERRITSKLLCESVMFTNDYYKTHIMFEDLNGHSKISIVLNSIGEV